MEIARKKFVFYIDDETEYLKYGYIFGIFSYRWDSKSARIKNFNI